MENPGVSRAIPGALIGFAAGALTVLGLRYAQNMTPLWDTGVALVLTPFTMMAGWLWGIGAFNPKLSEHGEHHEEDHAIVPADGTSTEEAFNPLGTMMPLVWRTATYSLLVIGIFYGLAALPTGLFLQTANEADANVGAFASNVVIDIEPLGIHFETTQMVMFLAFVAFTILSLVLFAGGIAFLVYMGHRQVVDVASIERSAADKLPPAPVRGVGRAAKGVARGLRNGLPRFFGMK